MKFQNVRMLAVVAAVCLLALPVVSLAANVGLVQEPGFLGTVSGNTGLVPALRIVINGLLVLVAIVATIYLVIGGLKYITSQGDEGKAEEAKNTILYALIGLVVIGLSAVAVNFILNVLVNNAG